MVLHPSCEGAVEVVRVEEGAEGHRVQVHGLNEVGQEGALDAEDVPPGELVWEKENIDTNLAKRENRQIVSYIHARYYIWWQETGKT